MRRRTAVTVFGILNIGFGVLGIFGLLGTMLVFAMIKDTTSNPVIQLIHNNPAYAAWMNLSIVLGLAARVVLLAAGIGLLKLKPWARMLSIAYAIYAIVMILVGTVVNFIFWCNRCWSRRIKNKDRKSRRRHRRGCGVERSAVVSGSSIRFCC